VSNPKFTSLSLYEGMSVSAPYHSLFSLPHDYVYNSLN